jgi:hypothetical protein
LSGKKGSGKDTLADVIGEHFGRSFNKFHSQGQTTRSLQERSFKMYTKVAFADLLKAFCIDVLGLQYNQCYGTDDDKETPTEYKWKNTPLSNSRSGRMTGREIMQIFGTECIRTWFGNVWAEATIRKIRFENPRLAIITDNRFPSEVETVLAYPRGHIIRLTRSPYDGDEHASETSLDDFDWERPRCYILENARMTKSEQEEAIIPILDKIFQQELGNGCIR